MAENIDVVVIGGGYAGVMAANRLTRRDDVTVTLINPRPTFVHRIRLHQLVAGTDKAVVDYQEVLAPDVRLEFVCAGIVKHLAGEARKPGSYGLHRVPGGAGRRELLRAERGGAAATAAREAEV